MVIEDAAQGMMSTYKGKPLGTIGHIGAFSFHETKNYTSGGEGGLLIINDESLVFRSEVMREKGTNRSQFFRGQVDKYTWVSVGSSYLPSELQAAFLWGQLEKAEMINQKRLALWALYYELLSPLQTNHLLSLPIVPNSCQHNAHMFYIKLKDVEERTAFIEHLKQNDVMAVFHYVPLHSSPAGEEFGSFVGVDEFTTQESERLVRLPLYYSLTNEDVKKVCNAIKTFLDAR
jgi:dTDP-4-amino-4,6-dideoxygalactose transaminase